MKVTRKMVAARAGITEESVSYVLNRSRPVSDEIVKKVMDAVNELGYVPDVGARSLGNKKTMSIGVICNDLSNPYYSEILNGAEDAARKKNYIIIITEAGENIRKNINNMIARRVDGILFLVFPDKFNYDYKSIIDEGIKIAVTHNFGYNDKKACHLEPDFNAGIRDALNNIKQLGHSEIVMLSAFGEEHIFDIRLACFKKHYKNLFGKEPVCLVAQNSATTIESGKKIAETFLESGKKATALLFTNDLMAIGAIHLFKQQGIRVPEDISVIGIDDMIFSPFFTPSLSTLHYDKIKFGNRLFNMLYDNIYENKITDELFPLRFIKRDSVKSIVQ